MQNSPISKVYGQQPQSTAVTRVTILNEIASQNLKVYTRMRSAAMNASLISTVLASTLSAPSSQTL